MNNRFNHSHYWPSWANRKKITEGIHLTVIVTVLLAVMLWLTTSIGCSTVYRGIHGIALGGSEDLKHAATVMSRGIEEDRGDSYER